MKLGVMSSTEARFYTERAHQLRNEYFAQQLERAIAALARVIRSSQRAKTATGGSRLAMSRQHGPAM